MSIQKTSILEKQLLPKKTHLSQKIIYKKSIPSQKQSKNKTKTKKQETTSI